MRNADESAPLLSHTVLSSVPEEESNEHGGEQGSHVNVAPSQPHRKPRKGPLVGGSFRRVSFVRSSDVLPLHLRRSSRGFDPPQSLWKSIVKAFAAVSFLIFVICVALSLHTDRRSTSPPPAPPFPIPKLPPRGRNPAYLITAKNGAVATENEVCSNVGVDVLRDGGNAVDAAVASTFCIGVLNMFS